MLNKILTNYLRPFLQQGGLIAREVLIIEAIIKELTYPCRKFDRKINLRRFVNVSFRILLPGNK